MILLIAFSFGKRGEVDNEPGPANRRIAGSVLRVIDAILHDGRGPVMVVAEWEVAKALRLYGLDEKWLIPVYPYETFFRGREGVWEKAKEETLADDYQETVIVASPRLRLKNQAIGISPITNRYDHLVGHVGFDRHSRNFYTRGPIRYYYHKIRNRLAKRYGRRYYWAED